MLGTAIFRDDDAGRLQIRIVHHNGLAVNYTPDSLAALAQRLDAQAREAARNAAGVRGILTEVERELARREARKP